MQHVLKQLCAPKHIFIPDNLSSPQLFVYLAQHCITKNKISGTEYMAIICQYAIENNLQSNTRFAFGIKCSTSF